jgi:shikimate dehydrogenase
VSSTSILEKCCLIGYPIAGNPTHYIMEQALRQAGLDWRFLTFEVSPEALDDSMRGVRALGFRGVKIAEPFNESILSFLDELTDQAKQGHSVNCVIRRGDQLVGDNTEGPAVVELIREFADPAGKRVLLFGSGRIARAIAAALCQSGIAAITFVCRSHESGHGLIESIDWPDETQTNVVAIEGASLAIDSMTDIVINATPVGSEDDQQNLPVVLDTLRPELIVADVVFNPPQTPFVRAATKRGCRVIDGVSIFVRQNALALRLWASPEADMTAMREALEEFLSV